MYDSDKNTQVLPVGSPSVYPESSPSTNMTFTVPEVLAVESPYPRNVPKTVSEIIEEIGVGKTQILAVIAATLCLVHYILDVLGIGMILPMATCELQLDTTKKGFLMSAPFLGLVLCAHLWGFLADTIGRQRSVTLGLSSCVLFSILAALTPHFWSMLTLRLLSGMANAGATSAMYPYVREILPQRNRSEFMVFIAFAPGIGQLLVCSVGWLFQHFGVTLMIAEDFFLSPWRQQLVILCLPGVIGAIIFHNLPESPEFWVSKGETGKAIEVLKRIERINKGKELEITENDLQVEESSDSSKKDFISTMKSFLNGTVLLFKKPFLVPMLGVCFIQCGIFTVGGAFGAWYPELTNRLSGTDPGSPVCEILSSKDNSSSSNCMSSPGDCVVTVDDKMFIDNSILGVSHLISTIFIYLCNFKFSIRSVISASLIISSLSGFFLPNLSDQWLVVGCFTLFIIGSGSCISIFNILAVEIFPTSICGTALSIGVLAGRIASFVATNLFGFLLEKNCEVTINSVALLIGLGVVGVFSLPKKIEENKN